MIDHHERNARLGTRKTAVNAKCCECMGWEAGAPFPDGISVAIRDCSAKTCPLHNFRPYKERT